MIQRLLRFSTALLWPRRTLLLAGLLFLGCLAVYVRTAAPSVLAGDSAEFQMAAPLLGVPHPTTYPLYILLGKLATLLLPFGDLAHRVTLVSAFASAATVGLFALLATRLTASPAAGGTAALALGVTPGIWGNGTYAEVYPLLALLLVALALALCHYQQLFSQNPSQLHGCLLLLVALIAGLGFTHHGLFVITAMPVFGIWACWQCVSLWRRQGPKMAWQAIGYLGAGFLLGMTPWLFPLLQYARFGPFTSAEGYGLPRHYFWGAPQSWGEAFRLLIGGQISGGIFRIPSAADGQAVLTMIVERLGFEFGMLSCLLGAIGILALLWQNRWVWLASCWVFGATCGYLLLLGAAVQDAPVFTLPMLLPFALWMAYGMRLILLQFSPPHLKDWFHHPTAPIRHWSLASRYVVLICLVLATVTWGMSRMRYTNKRDLWLFREFGQAALVQLPPNTVVIAHWEQGMLLQYLHLAEQQRPDVFIDVVEPGDMDWGERAQLYPTRPVYFVGSPADVAALPVEQILDDDYADLFRLQR